MMMIGNEERNDENTDNGERSDDNIDNEERSDDNIDKEERRMIILIPKIRDDNTDNE